MPARHAVPFAVAALLLLAGALGAAFAPSSRAPLDALPAAHHAGRDGGHAPADAAHATDHAAEAHDAHDLAAHNAKLVPVLPRHTHFRSGEPGTVPAEADRATLPHQLGSFRVRGDAGLAEMAGKGLVSGAGTHADPYVIEGFRVREDLTIEDTSKPLVVRDSLVEGTLRLNYIGPDVYVHHNRIHDLRVNENVERTGDTTAGLFEHNHIGAIGQLRHFSGEFARNTIGPRPAGPLAPVLADRGLQDLPAGQVWNFDGYHGAHVHNNTVTGLVDVKLHGHHHGDAPAAAPHDHAEEAEFPEGNARRAGLDPGSHHSLRFHTVDFERNRITVERGVALRFNDRDHAGDDRTAASEPNRYLEDLHDHHVFLRIAGNTLAGGPLVLDVVGAGDERHDGRVNEALVHLQSNRVTLPRPERPMDGPAGVVAAYVVGSATGLVVRADANAYRFTDGEDLAPAGYRWLVAPGAETSGFLVVGAAETVAEIGRTRGDGATYGVTVARTVRALDVRLHANRFNAEEDIHHA